MEVRQLHTFCVLAEELNFTRTAERVHTVQSNVTSQIKSLEAEMGSPLFDRLAKRVVLTEAGRRFLPYAEQALAAMDAGHRAVKFGTEPAGPLHIGSPESVLTYRLPEVLKLFRKRYPKVDLIFRPDSDDRLVDALESGRLDMAISMSDSVDGEQLCSLRMRTEDIHLFGPPDHPLANAKKVYLEDLAGQTLLLVNENTNRSIETRVVSARRERDGKMYVGLEFVNPEVNFWHMTFPRPGARPLRRASGSKATA